MDVYGEENELRWMPLSENFYDSSRFAGAGNVGHFVEYARRFSGLLPEAERLIALLRGLRRAFSPGKNDPLRADAADLLRVGCTIAVAAYHIWQQSWLDPAFSLFGLRVNLRNQVATGDPGVDLLLTLSGFPAVFCPMPRAIRRTCAGFIASARRAFCPATGSVC